MTSILHALCKLEAQRRFDAIEDEADDASEKIGDALDDIHELIDEVQERIKELEAVDSKSPDDEKVLDVYKKYLKELVDEYGDS